MIAPPFWDAKAGRRTSERSKATHYWENNPLPGKWERLPQQPIIPEEGEMKMNEKVWVISQTNANGEYEAVRAYLNESRAKEDWELIEAAETDGANWSLDEVELY